MPARDWNNHYATGQVPWDTNRPAKALVDVIEAQTFPSGKALEIGCGTGTNSMWLAARGFDVLGVDVSPLAIEQARSKADGVASGCRFEVHDFFADDIPGGPFDLVFDRGCFHSFDEADLQTQFAARVAELLGPDGMWLSMIGSTEGPARDIGPPRRSAVDIVTAIEPSLEILELRSISFDVQREEKPRAWLCLAKARSVPAQPSTGTPGF